jgi:hypothetical protein
MVRGPTRTTGARGGRALLGALLTAGLLGGHPADSHAYSATVSNGYYHDESGVFGPRHSLTKVDVQNTSPTFGAYGNACENALNADGTWAQANSYCAAPSGYTYHLFCGCQLRYGWNGPVDNATTGNGAWMVGIEYY